MTRGQTVRVRRDGSQDEWCLATVVLVSANGRSAGLMLEGAVRTDGGGVILGALPLIVDEAAETVTGLEGTLYEIEIRA